MKQEMEDRMALKDLVDRYATESDKNNQDYYRERHQQCGRHDCAVQGFRGGKGIVPPEWTTGGGFH